MPVVPFRTLVTQPGNAPGWLRSGTGERYLYTAGLMLDARMERLVQGIKCRIPRSTIANYQAPDDALAAIGAQRGPIIRGPTESSASYAQRLQNAPNEWAIWGSPRSVLDQLVAYFIPSPVTVRLVTNSGHWYTMSTPGNVYTILPPASRPPNVSSNWTWDAIANDPSALTVTGSASGAGGAVQLTVSPSTSTIINGESVDVSGVLGTTESNGTWPTSVTDGTHVLLLRSKFTNAWSAGGTQVLQPKGAWWRVWIIIHIPASYSTNGMAWDGGPAWDSGPVWDGIPQQALTDLFNIASFWLPGNILLSGIIFTFLQPTDNIPGHTGHHPFDPTDTAFTDATGWTNLPTGNWDTGAWSSGPNIGLDSRPPWASFYNINNGP